MGVSGGSAAVVASCLGLLVFEAWLLSSPMFGISGAAAAWQANGLSTGTYGTGVATTLTNLPPTPPLTSACGWNPFCSIGNTWSAIVYAVQEMVYFFTQVASAFSAPYTALALVLLYSVAWPWLGVVNAVLIVIMVIAIVKDVI